MQKLLITAIVVFVAAGSAWWYSRSQPDAASTRPGAPPVTVPVLSGDALVGQQIFQTSCAVCHGSDAGGVVGVGPTLIDKVYRPASHGDLTILLAVRNGVRRHHWRFGPMLPVQGLSDGDVEMIAAFVRAVQRENGVQ